jgi:predicted TIM-barrel fold metal-dependent hydrolase
VIAEKQAAMPGLNTVCRNVPALRMAFSMFGVGHIMFGTDIPLREDIELQGRDIEALGLTAAELEIFTPATRRAISLSRSEKVPGTF